MDPQVWVGDDRPQRERMNAIQNAHHIKPNGGLWTSTLTSEDPISSGWIEWCRREGFWTAEDPDAWILSPSPDADLYTIDGSSDLRALADEYALELAYGIDTLDYEALAETYDGLHITEQGQADTQRTFIVRDLPDLIGWDCESTLWFSWEFTDVEHVGAVPTDPSVSL